MLFIVTFNCFWACPIWSKTSSNSTDFQTSKDCRHHHLWRLPWRGDHHLNRLLRSNNLPEADIYDLIMVTIISSCMMSPNPMNRSVFWHRQKIAYTKYSKATRNLTAAPSLPDSWDYLCTPSIQHFAAPNHLRSARLVSPAANARAIARFRRSNWSQVAPHGKKANATIA